MFLFFYFQKCVELFLVCEVQRNLSDWAKIALPLGGRVGLCICKFATIKHSFEDISPVIEVLKIVHGYYDPKGVPYSQVHIVTPDAITKKLLKLRSHLDLRKHCFTVRVQESCVQMTFFAS